MTDREMELAELTPTETEKCGRRSSHPCLRLAVSAFMALGCCELIATVWRAAGDDNRRQAIAAVRALQQARTSAQRVQAIQDLIRPVVIDAHVAVPPFIRALADPSIEVRVDAVRSLGRATCAGAMTGSADNLVLAALAALMCSLDDFEPSVRTAAVQALGAVATSRNPSKVIHPKRLVDALTAMLDDPDATVRASTIASLGFAGPSVTTDPPPALSAALHDESSFNREAAAQALARFSTWRGH